MKQSDIEGFKNVKIKKRHLGIASEEMERETEEDHINRKGEWFPLTLEMKLLCLYCCKVIG